MPRLARVSLLALALALPACSDSSGPDRLKIYGCDKGMRYSIGQTLSVEISTSDCTEQNVFYVDYYQFRLASDGPVSILVKQSGGSGAMYVELMGPGDVFLDGLGVDPGSEAAVGGQLEAGTYVIVVGGRMPGQSRYTLSSSAALPPLRGPFFNCTAVQAYTVGNTVSGTLGAGDCVAPYLRWMDRYQFTLTSTRTVTIDLASNDFDAYLYLFNAAGTVIAQNDDYDWAYDSRLSLSLPAGTYSIGATSYGRDEQGSYTLRVE